MALQQLLEGSPSGTPLFHIGSELLQALALHLEENDGAPSTGFCEDAENADGHDVGVLDVDPRRLGLWELTPVPEAKGGAVDRVRAVVNLTPLKRSERVRHVLLLARIIPGSDVVAAVEVARAVGGNRADQHVGGVLGQATEDDDGVASGMGRHVPVTLTLRSFDELLLLKWRVFVEWSEERDISLLPSAAGVVASAIRHFDGDMQMQNLEKGETARSGRSVEFDRCW